MSITTLTVGGNDYTSYATVAEADAYLLVDPTRGETWGALDADAKSTNLVAATRRLDLLNWKGEKTGGASQENQWPRTGVTYEDGTPVGSSELPKEVENATCLLAGTIALQPKASNQGSTDFNIKKTGAGSAQVEFFRPTSGVALQDETAYSLVSQFLGGGGRFGGTSGTTGELAESTFRDRDAPELDKGYA